MGNLAQRILVALIAAPLVLLIIYSGRPWLVWIVVFAVALLALHEFFSMALPAQDRMPALLIGGAASALSYWIHGPTLSALGVSASTAARLGAAAWPLLLWVIVAVPGLYYLFRYRDMQSVAHRFTATIAGTLYCGLGFSLLGHFTRDYPGGSDWLLMTLLIAWFGDTGGYFAGRFLGQRKLYEAVSPKKTWAGAIGGLVASIGAVVLIKVLRLPAIGWLPAIGLGAVAGAVGQLGDLVESLIKRSFGVKDSGAILPGHGGMLDRIDAVLFIAPVVLIFAALH